MAVSVQKGTFTKSGTSNVITTAFQVKALILFGHNVESETTTSAFTAHGGMTVGISDGTTHYCAGWMDEDAAATSDAYAYWNNKVWATFTTATGVVMDTGVASFGGSTDFTITWTNGGTPKTPIIHYIAIGGSDITNSIVLQKDCTRTTVGNQGYTGAGFLPDFAFFLTPGYGISATSATTSTDAAAACMGYGCAKSSTARWSTAIVAEDNKATSDTWRYQRTDRCLTHLDPNTGTVLLDADFVSFDSDGYTLNWATITVALATQDHAVLLLKGGVWDVGSLNQPAVTGNSDTVLTTGAAPAAVFLSSFCNIAATVSTANARLSVGALDASAQGSSWTGSVDANATAEVTASREKTDKCVVLATENATHTSSTIQAEAQLATNGLAVPGQFTLNWTTADATARQVVWWSVGTAVPSEPVSVRVGSFTKAASPQTINASFPVKALILYGHNLQSHAAGAFQAGSGMTVGISDGTNHRCVAGISQDAAATSVTRKYSFNAVWATFNETGTPATAGTGTVTFQGSTFTITWTSATDTPNINYIAIGGDDITNVKVQTFDHGTTSTGNLAYTGVGFQGDFALFLNASETATFGTAGLSVHAHMGIGAAVSSTKRWAIVADSEDARADMDTWRYQRTDKCIAKLAVDTGAVREEADFVSWGSDGFTLNWTDAPAVTGEEFAALIIKGGAWDVGNFIQPNATGNTDITLGDAGLTPMAAMLASFCDVAASTPQATSRIMVGAVHANSNEAVGWAGDTDAAAAAVCASIDLTTKCVKLSTENATHGSSTTQAEAELATNGMDVAGLITLNWTTVADSTDRELLYWTVGESAGGTVFEVTINEGAVTIAADTITTRARRVITDSSVSIGASSIVRRIGRVISDSAITIGASTITVRKRFIINESAITIGASTILTKVKRPIDEFVEIADNLSRRLSAKRTINEDAVTEDDVLTGRKVILKTITESAVDLADTIFRELFARRTISESTVPLDDTLSAEKIQHRTITETATTIVDTLVKRSRLVISDSLGTLSDSISKILFAKRTINEDAVTEDDVLTGKIVTQRSITEDAISIADTLLRRVRITIVETLSMSDNITKILDAFRTINEPSVSTDDSLSKRVRLTITESVFSIGDTLSLTINRVINETVSITDTLIKEVRYTISESAIAINDTLLRRVRLVMNETFSIAADTITKKVKRIISDTFIVGADNITRKKIMVRTMNENVGINDTMTTKRRRIITEATIAITDQALKERIVPRTITEAAVVIAADVLTSMKKFIRIINDTLCPGGGGGSSAGGQPRVRRFGTGT